MSSLVLDLQSACHNEVSIEKILLLAKTVASKLKQKDILVWLDSELYGYKNTENLPDYRWVRGFLRAHESFGRWIPVSGTDQAAAASLEKLCCAPFLQSAVELERIVLGGNSGTLDTMFPEQIRQSLIRQLHCHDIKLVVPRPSVSNVGSSVKGKILDWSLKLEEDGILGEGMSFSKEEQEKAANITTINITGCTGFALQHQPQGIITQNNQFGLVAGLNEFVAAAEKLVSNNQTNPEIASIQKTLDEIKTSINKNDFRAETIKPRLSLIKEILDKIIVNAGSSLIVQQITPLLPGLGHLISKFFS